MKMPDIKDAESNARLTFFDYLGMADVERVHSQMIAWIFSDDNKAISLEDKSKLLKRLFDIDIDNGQKITAEVEYDRVDVSIQAGNQKIIVENKLKSSKDPGQLKKIQQKIPKEDLSRYKHKFFLLSLIEEDPENNEWQNITYGDILKSFSEITPRNHEHALFFREYQQCLQNLTKTINKFLDNHQNFLNVFSDGSRKKKEKKEKLNEYGEAQRYIAKTNLETILQKLFWKKVAEKLVPKDKKYSIDETHGDALLEIHLKEFKDKKDKEFVLCLQFQGGSVKINMRASEYKNSESLEISTEMENGFFDQLQSSPYYKEWKENNVRKRAYISKSKKKKNFFKRPFQEIVNDSINEYKNAIEFSDNFILPKN